MIWRNLIYTHNPIRRILFRMYLSYMGSDIPASVKVGKGVKFPHGIRGIILHRNVEICNNVTIYHQVTCDMGITPPYNKRPQRSIKIIDGAILCAGAKIICNKDCIIVGRNTIIGANAVLTRSTGDNEI